MHDVKIFGERNTSTNALRKIIEQNSASRVFPSMADEIDPGFRGRLVPWQRLNRVMAPFDRHFMTRRTEAAIDRVFATRGPELAWKHTATRFDHPGGLEGRLVIFCVRNPWSWILSFYKNPYHILTDKPDSLEGFVDFPWRLAGRDNVPARTLAPMRLYEAKLKSYVDFMDRHGDATICRIVRFEDLILRPEEVWTGLRRFLKAPAETFMPLTSSPKSKDKDKTIDFYRDYYGRERWRPEVEPLIPRLQAQVLPDLLARFGYEAEARLCCQKALLKDGSQRV